MSGDTVVVLVCDYCNKIAEFDKEYIDGKVVRIFATACSCGSRTFVDITLPEEVLEKL
jgi:hypothetical protein